MVRCGTGTFGLLDTSGGWPVGFTDLREPESLVGEGVNKLMMSYITALIPSFDRDEEGQGLAEYALILALIAIVAIVALIFLGGKISGILSTVGNSI